MITGFMKNLSTLTLGFVALSASLMTIAGEARAQTGTAAKSPVSLSSEVRIERTETDAAGKEKNVLRDPKDVIVVPGDRVVFTLNVSNSGTEPAAGFRATNPIPAPVVFVAVTEDWAEVSVDNGVNWGKLATLSVKAKAADTGADIVRAAAAQDVTHVRWVFTEAIAPGSKTAVSYRGVVK